MGTGTKGGDDVATEPQEGDGAVANGSGDAVEKSESVESPATPVVEAAPAPVVEAAAVLVPVPADEIPQPDTTKAAK